MAQALHWARDETRLVLSGELDNDTLLPLWKVKEEVVAGIETIDVAALSRVDSAGLALMLHLCAIVRAAGKQVKISGMSENVVTLAQLYNLPASLLPVI